MSVCTKITLVFLKSSAYFRNISGSVNDLKKSEDGGVLQKRRENENENV